MTPCGENPKVFYKGILQKPNASSLCAGKQTFHLRANQSSLPRPTHPEGNPGRLSYYRGMVKLAWASGEPERLTAFPQTMQHSHGKNVLVRPGLGVPKS